jgi:hypothetical protein
MADELADRRNLQLPATGYEHSLHLVRGDSACREGKEEVGLDLKPGDLKILGLAQIWSAEDTGIHCLLLSATLAMTAAEAVRLTRYSDPVEGSWEVGDEVYAVSLWEDEHSVKQVSRWMTAAEEVIPQAVACVAALAAKTSAVRVADVTRGVASRSPRPDRLMDVFRTQHPYRRSGARGAGRELAAGIAWPGCFSAMLVRGMDHRTWRNQPLLGPAPACRPSPARR